MNNRLTLQDLAGLLAEYTGKDKKATERFLKDFIVVVSQGVYADKIVKVKGLGTFKILLVDKRESVHVNTGERFVIPAHYKFSFLPDKELKELVNKPFSFFETTELNEDVNFSDLAESVDDEKEAETEDESVEEMVPDEEIPVAAPALEPVPLEPEPPLPEEPAAQPQAVEEPEHSEPVHPDSQQSEPSDKPLDDSDEPSDRPRRSSSFLKTITLLCALALAALLGFYLCMKRECIQAFIRGDRSYPTEIMPVDTNAKVPAVTDSIVVPADSIPEIPEEKADSSLLQTAEQTPPAQHEVIGRTTIQSGDRLTLIAREYYGHKLFWVYLYEYNKAKITNPNNIPIGTEIEIPAASLYDIDAKSRASLEKAAIKQTEILTRDK